MRKNWDKVGIFPILGSIMLAILRPIPPAIICPALISAASTICRNNPIKRPIAPSLAISPIALNENGSTVGGSVIGSISQVMAAARAIFTRRLTADIP